MFQKKNKYAGYLNHSGDHINHLLIKLLRLNRSIKSLEKDFDVEVIHKINRKIKNN